MILSSLIKRNTKMFFKDKGLFFTSLITPLILLVLYTTFLGNVYKDSFAAGLGGFPIEESVLNSVVAGQLVSSLLAVSCVTVSFCSNMLMVQDKVSGAINDLSITPVKPATLALGYYISTLFSTLIISLIAAGAGLAYIAVEGWYLTAADILMMLLDVVLLVFFGTALSSAINFFLSSQGQISAVGSIVSSVYGFICGAYMPISQFGEGLQKVLMLLPGTYATSLLRTHLMRGAIAEVEKVGFPPQVIETLKDTADCNIYFFGERIADWVKLTVLSGSVILLVAIYVALNMTARKRRK